MVCCVGRTVSELVYVVSLGYKFYIIQMGLINKEIVHILYDEDVFQNSFFLILIYTYVWLQGGGEAP